MQNRTWTCLLAGIMGLLISSQVVCASRIIDLTRMKGDQPNELVGIGLVFGLKGTGDGGDFLPAVRPLQAMLGRFQNPVTISKELKSANNVALVSLSVRIPPAGAHEGDRLDVKVSSIGAAKSLKGGRLFIIPLQGPSPKDNRIYGTASGDLVITEEAIPTQATIAGGATLLCDFQSANVSKNGKFTLVLQAAAAGYANAAAIADQINEDVMPQTDGKPVAEAVDATTVEVTIPKAEIARPAQFIARIQQLPVPQLPGTAKVLINTKSKTIVFTGDVELSPTVITHRELSITVTAPNTPANPVGSQVNFVALDPAKKAGPKLKDLVEAFNLLKVSADDRINIVKQLHESGALHCQLQVD